MAKRLVFSDETINSYGFYLVNAGADLSLFKKNPIMLWMHNRPWRGTKDEVLALGTVENISFNETEQRWEGDPVFDMKDPFAAQIAQKWEDGIYRMCSAGIKPVEWSSEPTLLKPGQTRETVTKWILKEISIVDIGSNHNAVQLYNQDDEVIELSDKNPSDLPIPLLLSNQKNSEMEVIKLADGTQLTLAQVEKLHADNATQQQTIQTLTSDRDGYKTKVEAFELAEKNARKTEAENLVDAATKDGRIDATPGADGKSAKEQWLNFFETNHEGAKLALASIPKRTPVAGTLAEGATLTELEKLTKLSWDELDRGNHLETVKTKYYDLYESKFEEKFGKKPKK